MPPAVWLTGGIKYRRPKTWPSIKQSKKSLPKTQGRPPPVRPAVPTRRPAPTELYQRLVLPAEKELPYFLPLLLTLFCKKLQLDAVPAHFILFFDFFETVGHLEGHQCAPPLQYTAGGRARHSRFRGNLGVDFFFRSKIDFFSITN